MIIKPRPSPLRFVVVSLALRMLRLVGTRAFALDAGSAAVVMSASTGQVMTVMPERPLKPATAAQSTEVLEAALSGVWALGVAEVAKDPTGAMSLSEGLLMGVAGHPNLVAIADRLIQGFNDTWTLASALPSVI